MTYDDALKIVERQCNMLARIREEQRAAADQIKARLRGKIERGEQLDTMEFCAAQDFGLLTATGEIA